MLHGMRNIMTTGCPKFALVVEIDDGLQRAAGHDPMEIERFMVKAGWYVAKRASFSSIIPVRWWGKRESSYR